MDPSRLQPEQARSPEKLLTRFNGYLAVSALSFVINIGLTSLLHEAVSLKPMWAFGISLTVLFCINFTLMRYWVYRKHLRPGTLRRQFVATMVTSGGFRLTEWLFFVALNEFLKIYYLPAMLIVMGTSFLLKFFVYDKLIFGKTRPLP
jgi:putative flippase GtrA